MRYIWILFNTVIWTTLLGFFGIVVSIFEPRRGRTLGYCANLWAKLILFFGGVKYSVKGLEFLKSNGSYIFAGNHASEFDILLAFAGLPYWVVSIAKIELKSAIKNLDPENRIPTDNPQVRFVPFSCGDSSFT